MWTHFDWMKKESVGILCVEILNLTWDFEFYKFSHSPCVWVSFALTQHSCQSMYRFSSFWAPRCCCWWPLLSWILCCCCWCLSPNIQLICITHSDADTKKISAKKSNDGPSSLSVTPKNSWHIWNITVFISFSLSSPSNQVVVGTSSRDDYYLFIHFIAGCFACCVRVLDGFSVAHFDNSNKFSTYLTAVSYLAHRPPFFHIIWTKEKKKNIARWRQVDATFVKIEKKKTIVDSSDADADLIQFKHPLCKHTKLRTDWQIIQYYSFARKDEKKTEKLFAFFILVPLFFHFLPPPSLHLINRTTRNRRAPNRPSIQLVANCFVRHNHQLYAAQNSIESKLKFMFRLKANANHRNGGGRRVCATQLMYIDLKLLNFAKDARWRNAAHTRERKKKKKETKLNRRGKFGVGCWDACNANASSCIVCIIYKLGFCTKSNKHKNRHQRKQVTAASIINI